jgi:hypothetical protein
VVFHLNIVGGITRFYLTKITEEHKEHEGGMGIKVFPELVEGRGNTSQTALKRIKLFLKKGIAADEKACLRSCGFGGAAGGFCLRER